MSVPFSIEKSQLAEKQHGLATIVPNPVLTSEQLPNSCIENKNKRLPVPNTRHKHDASGMERTNTMHLKGEENHIFT